jgi:glutathione synthase/RimK-type ligase-like ATP-grasp enzyme
MAKDTMVDVRFVTCAQLPAEDADTPRLDAALRGRGYTTDVANWRDPEVNWSTARLTLLRSPWDYVERVDEFIAWVRHTGTVTPLWNPPELVEWNVHKSYLLDVEARGAPIVPTVALLRGTAASLDGICDARGWNTVVVKPAVGIGGYGAGRFDVGDPAGQHHFDALLAERDVLVQPFVSSVTDDGELSIVLFDGVPSHALHKAPRAGDYRVHEEWGGRTEATEPSDGATELAARVCTTLPAAPLYARIDMLRIGDLWHVLEVEATEPSLYIELAPPAAIERWADALVARLGE